MCHPSMQGLAIWQHLWHIQQWGQHEQGSFSRAALWTHPGEESTTPQTIGFQGLHWWALLPILSHTYPHHVFDYIMLCFSSTSTLITAIYLCVWVEHFNSIAWLCIEGVMINDVCAINHTVIFTRPFIITPSMHSQAIELKSSTQTRSSAHCAIATV